MNERIKLSGAAILLGENRVRSLSSSMSRSGIALVVGLIRFACKLALSAARAPLGTIADGQLKCSAGIAVPEGGCLGVFDPQRPTWSRTLGV